ncbi:MAG: TonB family protein [Loktanella sp.]|nr:TonB family protein [Loktanella sp.]
MTRPRIIGGATIALALSGGLHAAVLLIAVPPEDETVQVSGAGVAEIAALGAAFEDFVAGSTPVTQVAQPAVQMPAIQPGLTLPTSAVADLAAPVPAREAETSPPAVTTVTAASAAVTAVTPDATTATASDVTDTESAPTSSIRPVARPAAPPQRTAQAAPPRPAGNAETDANRGSAQGQDGGQAAASGTAAPAQDTAGGREAVANYPGQVLRQITRLRRQNAPARGSVLVNFAISGSGALADVAVARSSGSGQLDQMAMDHIRRAAPFPPPPAGAQTAFSFEFVGRP